jgi:methyl-accepting chemotaxis protein
VDFEQAIDAHLKWKVKLMSHLNQPDASLDISVIEKDDRCPLGQWLHSVKAQYGNHPEFATLLKDHAAFHKEVATIINRKNKGEALSIENAIGTQSNFKAISQKVVTSLMKLKKEFKQ